VIGSLSRKPAFQVEAFAILFLTALKSEALLIRGGEGRSGEEQGGKGRKG